MMMIYCHFDEILFSGFGLFLVLQIFTALSIKGTRSIAYGNDNQFDIHRDESWWIVESESSMTINWSFDHVVHDVTIDAVSMMNE